MDTLPSLGTSNVCNEARALAKRIKDNEVIWRVARPARDEHQALSPDWQPVKRLPTKLGERNARVFSDDEEHPTRRR